MLNMRTRALLLTGLVPAAALSTNAAVALGWSIATLTDNGTVIRRIAANGDSLPSGMACSITGSRSTVSVTGGVALKGRDYAKVVKRDRSGNFDLSYKLYSDVDLRGTGSLRVKALSRYSITANVMVEANPGSASAEGRVDLVERTGKADLYGPGLEEAATTAGTWRLGPQVSWRGANPTWSKEADGRWSTLVRLNTIGMGGRTTGYHNSPGGSMTVVTASSSGGLDVDVTSFEKVATSSAKTIEGTAPLTTNLPLVFDVFSENNILELNTVTICEADGTFWIPMDGLADGLYHVYAKPFAGLRKRFDVLYTQAGLAGIVIDFKWGDIDGDNRVTQSEVDFITAMIGMTKDHPDWESISLQYRRCPVDADIDRDGAITAVDLALALPNLGLIGD